MQGMVRTRVDATADIVERRAERVRLGRADAAARVARARDGAVRRPNNVARDGEHGCVGCGERASRVRVQRDLVVRVIVHALDDVDLTTVGPVRTCSRMRGDSQYGLWHIAVDLPFDQNAGQVPQPVGMWTASRTMSAPVYVKSVVMRTLRRYPEVITGVVSTFRYALPALLMPVRLADS